MVPSRPSRALHVSQVGVEAGFKCEFFQEPSFGLHTHAHLELMVVLTGSGKHWVNGEMFPLLPGDVWLLGPYQSHHARYDHGSGGRHFNLGFPLTLITGGQVARGFSWQVLAPYLTPGTPSPFRLDGPTLQKLLGLMNLIVEEAEVRDPWHGALSSNLIGSLVHRLARCAPAPRAAADGAVLATLARIASGFREPVSTRALAAAEGLGSARLAQRFAKATGLTIKGALTERRLQEARRLLAETDLNVTEVGLESGFADLSYFNRAFKGATGLTASGWRKKHRL